MQTQDNMPMCYRRGNRRIQQKTSQCYENGEVELRKIHKQMCKDMWV